MIEINKDNLSEVVVSGEFDIQASFSSDLESKIAKDSKQVTLRFKMDKVALQDIIHSSLKDKRINIQSTMRKKPEQYKQGQILNLDYKGGKAPLDIKIAFQSDFDNSSAEEQDKMIALLIARKAALSEKGK
jgi:hypothetical protein